MPVVIADGLAPDAPIGWANQAFLDLSGYTAGEVLVRNCRFMQGLATALHAVEEIQRVMASQRLAEVAASAAAHGSPRAPEGTGSILDRSPDAWLGDARLDGAEPSGGRDKTSGFGGRMIDSILRPQLGRHVRRTRTEAGLELFLARSA